jgi:hypothetical protein
LLFRYVDKLFMLQKQLRVAKLFTRGLRMFHYFSLIPL